MGFAMNKQDEMKYAEMYSKWYSWGSPIGLGIFFICLTISARIIVSTINGMKESCPQAVTTQQVPDRDQ